MKIKTSLICAILLIFICCIGAASAADDINDDSLTVDDEAVVAEQVDDADLQSAESDDATLEINNAENENLRATSVTVTNWSQLAGNASSSGDKTINLASGVTYTPTSQIVFGNNAKIVGTSTSYISGSYSGIPFYNSNSNYHITFQNVKFKDISCTMLMQMLTTGTTVLDGCTFTNVNASSSGHNSVIYNNYGTMNITDCTFTNCRAAFGVVTNYNAASTTNVILNVKNSKFQNNYGYTEPGAINNCGILTVYNSTFIGNHAVWWAGAIHTHSNANTLINKSTFKSNTAGWNGGALFTYSILKVYDSCFVDNNCSTNNGGGAIGAYNYGSQFDILINNCTFKKNNNLNSNGRGGAIGTLNGGYLNVYNSTFIANYAKTGQAIAAANSIVENGTSDKPRLAINGNKFINHTGSGDTVYINGRVSSFTNNIFINSTQNTHYGSGNTYNSIIVPQFKNNDILGVSISDILSSNEIQVSNNQELSDAFCDFRDGDTILVSDGTYNIEINFDDLWSLDDGLRFILIGTGDNVIFDMVGGYNLDSPDGAAIPGYNNVFIDVTHNNINFDCDVIVGSKNYKFINCSFNKGFKITHNYSNSDTYYQTIDITFDNCTFAFNKEDIQTMDYANLIFNDCTFPVTTVDSKLSITNETNVVIVTLTDAEGNPIKGAIVNYNTTTGVKESNTTGEDGTFKIYGLTGEFTINATYAGNESYNPSNNTASFNFKLPAVETTLNINSTEKGIVTITVKDAEGKPVANVEIKYTNGGENITKTTNDEGIVTVTGLTGEGEIKAYFEGNENYLKSEGLYKYNFTETTPAGNGTSGNGTSGNGTSTNPAGNGTSGNGTSTNPAGNGTSGNGTSTNTGKTTTNTPKVTKKATKITAKKATFKAKKKTKKYTIVLKAGKAAVKKVKVTLKVGKKTYKATTNSKGKATFKITKLNKKGKYTAVIKFAGNKNFKPTSKKVKITVKK